MEIIIGAIISAVVPAIIGVFLSKRIGANSRTIAAIHVLVNGRLHDALAKIIELEASLLEMSDDDKVDKPAVIEMVTEKIEEIHGTETPND